MNRMNFSFFVDSSGHRHTAITGFNKIAVDCHVGVVVVVSLFI